MDQDRPEAPGSARAPAQPAPPAATRDRASEAIIGLIATPLAAIAGGSLLTIVLHFPKFAVDRATDVLGLFVFFGLFGSFFAAPTTLFGLPAVSIFVPRSTPGRPLLLAAAGFGLGWLTMMVWSLLFFGPRVYARLGNGYEAKALASFCLVGAVCGAVTGLMMGLLTLRLKEHTE